MISVRSLLLAVALGTGFTSTWAKHVRSRASSADVPDPSFAVSVELDGAKYVNKVRLPPALYIFSHTFILLEIDAFVHS